MSSRSTGRHRAPSSEKSTSTQFSFPQIPRPHLSGSASPVAKAGAVIAVSGGLVASLGMQANAATITPVPKAVSTSSPGTAVTSTVASGVPAALASGLVSAPQSPQVAAGQFGEIGFTAAAKPVAKARTTRPFAQRSSRSATRLSVSSADASTDGTAEDSTTEPSTTEPSTTEPSTTEPSDPVESAPPSIKAGAPGSGEFGASVLAIAARYAGIDYRYGGTTPAGFDCSGYTSYVLAQVGVDLPRTSGAQRAGTARISRSEAVAGDLVFMPGHVGIYAGNGMMWDSPRSGKDVSMRPVYSSSATFGRIG